MCLSSQMRKRQIESVNRLLLMKSLSCLSSQMRKRQIESTLLCAVRVLVVQGLSSQMRKRQIERRSTR